MSIHRHTLSLSVAIALADADEARWGPEPSSNEISLAEIPSERSSLHEDPPCDQALPMEEPDECYIVNRYEISFYHTGLAQDLPAYGPDESVIYDPSDPSRYLPDHDPGGVGEQVDRMRSFIRAMRSFQGTRSSRASFVSMIARQIPESIDPENFLRNASPIPPSSVTPAAYLGAVFREGETVGLVNEYESLYCANPMHDIAREYPGRFSRHSRECIAHFRHIPVRFRWNKDRALRLLLQLHLQILSITCTGESVEALILIPSRSYQEFERQRAELAEILFLLGAFRNSTLPNGLIRLPQVQRGDELAELLYLNPNPDCNPMITYVSFPDVDGATHISPSATPSHLSPPTSSN